MDDYMEKIHRISTLDDGSSLHASRFCQKVAATKVSLVKGCDGDASWAVT